MKPPPVEYVRPADLTEALDALAQHGDEAKVLAGGQSLVPMLNLRLARPEVLVDVGRLPLRQVGTDNGHLVLGALVSHRQVEVDPLVAAEAPMLARAAAHIGHLAIRHRGTLGGSIAHADPVAEMVLTAVALHATFVATGPRGDRTLEASGFFRGAFTTRLEPDELLVEVRFPRRSRRERHGFAELSRRTGDFAVAAAACVLPEPGATTPGRVAVAGMAPAPQLLPIPPESMPTRHGDCGDAAIALVSGLSLDDDSGSAGFRRQITRAVVADALAEALGDSGGA